MLEQDNNDLNEPQNSHDEHILVVDDEAFVRGAFQLYLETHGYQVTVAEDGPQAIRIASGKRGSIDAVLLDLVMPGMYGVDVLNQLKEIDPTTEIIIATGCGSVHSAVEAMRYGAFDYITKPIVDFEQDLLLVVRAAVQARRDKCLASQDPTASAPTRLALLSFYKALEELSWLRGAPEEFDAALVQVLSQHFGANGALILAREPQGVVICERAWGGSTLSRRVDPDATLLAFARLWDELEKATEGWNNLRLGSATLDLLPVPKTLGEHRGCQSLTIPLSTDPRGGDKSVRMVLLRSTAAEVPRLSLPTGLLSALMERANVFQRPPSAGAAAGPGPRQSLTSTRSAPTLP